MKTVYSIWYYYQDQYSLDDFLWTDEIFASKEAAKDFIKNDPRSYNNAPYLTIREMKVR